VPAGLRGPFRLPAPPCGQAAYLQECGPACDCAARNRAAAAANGSNINITSYAAAEAAEPLSSRQAATAGLPATNPATAAAAAAAARLPRPHSPSAASAASAAPAASAASRPALCDASRQGLSRQGEGGKRGQQGEGGTSRPGQGLCGSARTQAGVAARLELRWRGAKVRVPHVYVASACACGCGVCVCMARQGPSVGKARQVLRPRACVFVSACAALEHTPGT
jgi:hypothetical protein